MDSVERCALWAAVVVLALTVHVLAFLSGILRGEVTALRREVERGGDGADWWKGGGD